MTRTLPSRSLAVVLAFLALCVFAPAAAQAQPNGWAERAPSASPSARRNHAMAFDAARGVTVLFGGFGDIGLVADTWEWNGTDWTQRPVSGPSARSVSAMVYDSNRGVTVLFGGATTQGTNGETWEWNGTSWTLRATTGPSPRQFHAMAFDSSRGVTVLFGGVGSSIAFNSETWEWNGNTWTQRLVSGPSARLGHAMSFDRDRNVTVLFGGGLNGGATLADTWEWNGTAWMQRIVPGPSPRAQHTMVYDEARDVTLLFGGGGNGSPGAETWEWSGTAWRRVPITGPSTRVDHAMVFDSARGVSVLFGGWDNVTRNNESWEISFPVLFVNKAATGTHDGSSWSNAFSELRDALAFAAANSFVREIWVARGTYTPSPPFGQGGSRSASFNLQNNLAIYGGFQGNETLLSQRNIAANPTILSGDLNDDDPQGPNRNENSFSVVTANQLNPSAVLDGVTVTRGNAKDSPSNQGGGILIIGGGGSGPLWKQGPLFRNLTVRENFSDTGSGGGVSAQSAGRAQFEQTRFLFNGSSGFGGAVAQSANSHVGYTDCQFERNSCNTQSGGAMYVEGGAVAYLTNCSFVKNRAWTAGGAIHVRNNARLIGDQCTFYGNTALAGSGGALFLQDNAANPSVDIRNSVFVGNTAKGAGADGAAIKSGLSYSVFTNCTIVANESAAGAAVQLNYQGISFVNCFLYGNTSRDNSTSGEAAQTSSGFGGVRNFQHSTVQGWSGSLGGANNNGLDPIFIRYPSKGLNNEWDTNDSPVYDDDYGDLRLSSNSPAIDSGDSLAVPADTYDIDADGNTTEALP
ncbi:MAG: right-handed parallel beta-helix repeat-containing protein, partial [Phycisphaerae bacterium]